MRDSFMAIYFFLLHGILGYLRCLAEKENGLIFPKEFHKPGRLLADPGLYGS